MLELISKEAAQSARMLKDFLDIRFIRFLLWTDRNRPFFQVSSEFYNQLFSDTFIFSDTFTDIDPNRAVPRMARRLKPRLTLPELSRQVGDIFVARLTVSLRRTPRTWPYARI
jgi:hypothetical protein